MGETLMSEMQQTSPAEIAAQRALEEVFNCIRNHKNFRLEAGAGAGKTYSLIMALKLIINEQGDTLQRQNQQVACITYTNVATDEIISRIDGHPAVHVSTIHSFCWNLIKNFQPLLRTEISKMDVWSAKFESLGGIGTQKIDYNLGYRSVDENILLLHHDDVLNLTVALMSKQKFKKIFTSRFPIIFIDEYQDTNTYFANSFLQNFIECRTGPLIGFFGDSWQKIYQDGIGLIEHENLKQIGKNANFRSEKDIVDVLNRIRPSLPQEPNRVESDGSVSVYHSNEWSGTRQSTVHWKGDLPSNVGHQFLVKLQEILSNEEWEFSKTKILMLTHRILAEEQEYAQIIDLFRYNESAIKKENPYIEFFVDSIEPACEAFKNGRYGEMFAFMSIHSDCIRSFNDKKTWAKDIKTLNELRETGTIGDVLDHLKKTHHPRLPEKVLKTEKELESATPEDLEESRTLQEASKLREVPYTQLISLALFINNHTPFSTKHGVKGAEFENVLVVLGRGWNLYNWNQFLEWFPDRYPADKINSYERNRNLFYVACSRPKKRLALLFTQELSEAALDTLRSLFGAENVKPLTIS